MSDSAIAIRHPRLRRLLEYWNERRGKRNFPAREDIDPLDMSYLMGDIMLVEVGSDRARFRVRLHGTNLVVRAGYDLTGKYLDDIPYPKYRAYVIERCQGLVAEGKPLALVHDREVDGRVWHYEALWLPLGQDARTPTMLLCALVYLDEAAIRREMGG